MKIGIIGGAGVRVPLLVHGLTSSDLPIGEIALYDVDRDRLALIGRLAGRRSGQVRLTIAETSAECIEGADYVFVSIRVGGIDGRARDEQLAMAHGIVGQETVGPGGFAMAFRTVPEVVRYATEVAARAPHAWIINFTNPVGIVTQAVQTATPAKIIGICDTPTELFEEIAHILDLPSRECYFDYFGLNHLGWVREVYHDGEPQLHRVWAAPATLDRLYRAPLFPRDLLMRLRLVPTEYCYYYYRPDEAYENLRRSGQTRGLVIQQLNARLFEELARGDADPVGVYERYLAARNAGYMQLESGASSPLPPSPWAELTGYDKIALETVRAIHGNTGALMPLNVRNRGNLPDLDDEDSIEVTCVVNANGAIPIHAGPVSDVVRDLLVQVKRYERLTVRAALTGEMGLAEQALACNPLVKSADQARRLVAAMVAA
ncbi:MAG: family 4 glycosyl hydrolase [Acidobacteriota bacterium]